MSGLMTGFDAAFPNAVKFTGDSNFMGLGSLASDYRNGLKDTFMYYLFGSLDGNVLQYILYLFLFALIVGFVVSIFFYTRK